MARRSGLGKGLGALIPPDVVEGPTPAPACRRCRSARSSPTRTSRASTSTRRPSPRWPRRSARSGCSSRSSSASSSPDRYELIAGERRWRAAKRAGLQTIPAIVRDVDDELDARAGAGREPPPRGPQPARGGGRLPAAHRGLRPDPGGRRPPGRQEPGGGRPTCCGCSSSRPRSSASSPTGSCRPATPGRCSARPTAPSRRRSPGASSAEGLSVREVEEAVRQRHGPRQRPSPTPDGGTARQQAPAARPARARGAARRPPRHPGEDQHGPKRGKVVIEFADLEDLERIYRVMATTPRP